MARRQLFVFGMIFVGVTVLLAIIYFAFLRANYTPLFENLRETDASAVVGELDKQGIAYKLENGGQSVLVAEPDVAKARLALAGSGLALGGVVGFELFNESDMGLTEFAQKINYQRALQGELSRTIMMMDGIEFARVHLALPERSIFRNAQSQPTAAVTIQTIGRKDLAPDRVAGIQQLVASSVSDLPVGNVAILDERGDLLNQVGVETVIGGSVVDERTALEQYFRARAQTVVSQLIPGLRSEIRVFARKPIDGDSISDAATNKADSVEPPPAKRGKRNFELKVVVRTTSALSEDDMALLRPSIAEALELNLDGGDSFEFDVGPLGQTANGSAPVAYDPLANAVDGPSSATSQGARTDKQLVWLDYIFNRWFALALVLLAITAHLFWRQKRQLSDEERDSFADLLNDAMTNRQASGNAS